MVDFPAPDSPLIECQHVFPDAVVYRARQWHFSSSRCITMYLQEKCGLILLTTTKSRPHPARKLLSSAHSASFLVAIGTFGGAGIRVDRHVSLRGEAGNGLMAVVSRCNMTGDVGIAHGMGRQSRQILLRRWCRHLCGMVASWPEALLQLQHRWAS